MSRSADKAARRKLSELASIRDICLALRDLYRRFQDVEDPRSTVNRKYSCPDILMLLILGLLIGKNDPTNIHNILSRKSVMTQVNRILGYKGQIPSKQVFLSQLALVSPRSIMTVVDEWLRQYVNVANQHVALDGKAVRAALEKIRDKHNPPYILNAVEIGTGMFVLQEKVGEKTNEAATLPGFASKLELNGADVTIDAAGTHASIADIILSSDGHFCLPVKDNQKHMKLAIQAAFADAEENQPQSIDTYEDNQLDHLSHGRFEYRAAAVMKVAEDSELHAFLQKSDFRDMVNAVGKVIRYRQIKKQNDAGESVLEWSEQVIYYIISKPTMTAERLLELSRGHWSVESAHYILDTEFDEDRSTIKKGYGMENMSMLRKIAFNIIRMMKKILGKGYSFSRVRDELFTNMKNLSGLFRPFSKRELRTVFNT